MFCKIIDDEIPADVIYRDDSVVAFRDINPQAPVHFLVVPVRHISDICESDVLDDGLLVKVFGVIQKLSIENELENGFRIVNNYGKDGCQTINHLHFHVLGRRALGWPPG